MNEDIIEPIVFLDCFIVKKVNMTKIDSSPYFRGTKRFFQTRYEITVRYLL